MMRPLRPRNRATFSALDPTILGFSTMQAFVVGYLPTFGTLQVAMKLGGGRSCERPTKCGCHREDPRSKRVLGTLPK